MDVSDGDWDQVCRLSRYLVQPAACTADIEIAAIAPPYVPPGAWVEDPPQHDHGVWRGDCQWFCWDSTTLKFTTECENMTDLASGAEDGTVAMGRRQINAMRTVNETQKLMFHW